MLLTIVAAMTGQNARATITGSGTSADPYVINDDADWETFADWINNQSTNSTYRSKYYKLGADINVSTMVGTGSSYLFRGTFDGDGHTMTLNLTSSSDNCAPFRYVSYCTIKRLHVGGSITTTSTNQNAGGLIGQVYDGTVNIINCWSSVTINSNLNSNSLNGRHGGFVGFIGGAGTTTITNCRFDGSLLAQKTTKGCGGFVGNHYVTSKLNIANCLFAPTEITFGEEDSSTFSCNGYTALENSYYTMLFGAEQGTAVGTRTDEELLAAFGRGWEIKDGRVVPVLDIKNIAGGSIVCSDFFNHTGSEIAVTPTVKDMDGNVIDAENYSVTYSPSPVKDKGDYTMTVTGNTSNGYSGTLKHNFFVDFAPMNLSIDRDFSLDELGYYYVNMPVNGTTAIDLSVADFTTPFKVYDTGGKNGKYLSGNSHLQLTAPEGYVIQLSGTVKTYATYDYLRVYDDIEATSVKQLGEYQYTSTSGVDIGELITTGRYMHIYFRSTSNSVGEGLDLTVTLLSTADLKAIIVNDASGGSVEATPGAAGVGSTVTLTATPENSSYLPADFTVVDEAGKAIHVEGGWYTDNVATFTMPKKPVTVTPTFTNKFTAEGGLYVTMPLASASPADAKVVNIPAGVTSFKVYDYAGKNGSVHYSKASYLLLKAPEGCVLEVTGTVYSDPNYQWFHVYNSSSNTSQLTPYGFGNPSGADIGAYTSTSNKMLLYFFGQTQDCDADLDLTVRVINASAGNYNYKVADHMYGGLTPNLGAASVNSDVNMTVNAANGFFLNKLVIKDGANHDVSFTGGLWYSGNEVRFKMPANYVNITPTFVSKSELSVDMPVYTPPAYAYALKVNIPEKVTSFKIYDNGGAEGNYSNNRASYHNYMLLTAPEGCTIRVTGTTKMLNSDYLYFYDSNSDSNQITCYTGNKTIDVESTGKYMLLHFYHYESGLAAGFDLKAEVIRHITLADNDSEAATDAKNSAVVAANDNLLADVTLDDRTLKKNGEWNTLCLPFDVVLANSPLAGATAKTLTDASVNGNTVSLTFGDAVTTLSAGVPYIIKWAEGEDIVNPVFTGVTIDKTDNRISPDGGQVQFIGYYGAFDINATNTDIYYMTAGNTLRHTGIDRTLKACRAYFQFTEPAEPNSARSIVLNFGDEETTGVVELKNGRIEELKFDGAWYSIDGLELDKKPTRKGLYIFNGKKIVIK